VSAPPFAPIWERALGRKGATYLEEHVATPLSDGELAGLSDDRWLSAMSLCVFAAGFRWRVVRAKWGGFEDAFMGFVPSVVAELGERERAGLRQDPRIVRNPQKIAATVANAAFVRDTAREHGTFSGFVQGWGDDLVGLWAHLAKHGARLGGMTGPRTLRVAGKDTFLLTPDVCRALAEVGVITEAKATSAKAKRAAQEAFLAWRAETGLPLSRLSLIVACSTEAPPAGDDEDGDEGEGGGE
jgi:3-methyladenine DNA glycosylase Tag